MAINRVVLSVFRYRIRFVVVAISYSWHKQEKTRTPFGSGFFQQKFYYQPATCFFIQDVGTDFGRVMGIPIARATTDWEVIPNARLTLNSTV